MTQDQYIELELYIEEITNAIADISRITLKYNIPLYKDDELGIFYKNLINFECSLRITTDYTDILRAKDILPAAQAIVAKLEAFHEI